MGCCCRRQGDIAPINMGGVVKLDWSTGDVIWQHGFRVMYDPADAPFGVYKCWPSAWKIRYDPASNLVWGIAGAHHSLTKLFAFHKSGMRKFTVIDRTAEVGFQTSNVGTIWFGNIAFDGSGNCVCVLSTISGSFDGGSTPKICVVDPDGNIVSSGPSMASTWTRVNSTSSGAGGNVWECGSNFIFDRYSDSRHQQSFDASGSLIWNDPSNAVGSPGRPYNGQPLVGHYGTTFITGDGLFVDGTTGHATGSVIHGGGTGPFNSAVNAGNAGPGFVCLKDNTTVLGSSIEIYDINAGTSFNLPMPTYGTYNRFCVYVDGSVTYLCYRSSPGPGYVEAWDVTGTPSLLWTHTIDLTNDSNIQCFGITVDDDSNVYVI